VPLDPVFYAELLAFAKYKNPEDRIFIDARKQFGRIADKSGINLPAGQSTHVLRHMITLGYFLSSIFTNGEKILLISDLERVLRTCSQSFQEQS